MFYFASRIVSLTGAFLYPAYGSYKTLSHRPSSERDLERWLMYWSVLGCIIAMEYVAEWMVRWIPFYWEIKTSFLLYLALPQTQGATYFYVNHLEPFLTEHEQEIDSAVAKAKVKLYDFIQSKLHALWGHVSSVIVSQSSLSSVPYPPPPSHATQPTLANPGSSPAQTMWGLWRTYGPSVIAHGTALLTAATAVQTQVQVRTQQNQSPPITPPTDDDETSSKRSVSSGYSVQPEPEEEKKHSVIERRRRLEAALASLPRAPSGINYPPPPTSPSSGSTPEEVTLVSAGGGVASSVYLHSGEDDNGGKYEKIDREDVSETSTGSSTSPTAGRGGGWFGWGASKGYEKLKSD